MDANQTNPSSGKFLLVIAWLVVLIPAGWGVTQTIRQSMTLFKAPPPTTQATHT